VEAAARRLSERLDDAHSVAWYRKVCSAAARGEIPVKRLVSAFRIATSNGVSNPGARFNAALRPAE
jgi:hypothetical protein